MISKSIVSSTNMADTIQLVKQLKAQLAAVQITLADLEAALTPGPRALFCSPVTGQVETGSNPFGGDWFDATGYARFYNSAGINAYHTGCDLNRPAYADAGAPVYAIADGVICFARSVKNWQGDVVIVDHRLEDGSHIWTRYAHIQRAESILIGGLVKRGDPLGVIADYDANGPRGDHLHFDIARIDLGRSPGDWPGQSPTRVQHDYIDPVVWLKNNLST